MKMLKITRPCLLAALAMVPTTAWAQTELAIAPDTEDPSSTTGVAEIIVTAQKREQSIQDVPVAVTAFSGDALMERGVTDAQALVRLVPNMALSNNYGQVRITLRGLSFTDLATQGGEARVAYHVDGAYMGMTGDIGGTFYDIERVEVNRGPQGTLFGRNAIAGTVNLITRDPTDKLSGYLNAEIGNYETANLDGAISGPLAEGLSARLAFQTRHHSGYEYNVPNQVDINNQNEQAFRGKLKFDNGGALTAVLSADYSRARNRDGPLNVGSAKAGVIPLAVQLGGQVNDGDPRHHFGGSLPLSNRTAYGFTLDANLDLGSGLSLASLTNYRDTHLTYRYTDNSTIVLIDSQGDEYAEQFSQEFRLHKDFSRGNIILGGYFYSQDYNMVSINPALGILGSFIGLPVGSYREEGYAQGFTLEGGLKTTSYAGFGQVTFELTDSTTLIAGARYSTEKKRKYDELFDFELLDPFDPDFQHTGTPINDSVSYNNFSPRVTVEQKLGPDQLIYATYAKGFKAGGFNVGGLAPAYLPEKLTDYEVGLKLDLFDRAVRFNAAAFYYDYTDLQVIVAQTTVSRNVNAEAEIYGAEFELTAIPLEGLEIDLAGALIHSEFTNFPAIDPVAGGAVVDLTGNRLPFTPKYTLSFGAQYSFDTDIGEFTVRGDGNSKSQVYFDQFNRQTNQEDAFTILNASVAWRDLSDRFSVTGFVKNITDELVKNGTFMGGGLTGFLLNGRYDPPRTYGLRLGVKF